MLGSTSRGRLGASSLQIRQKVLRQTNRPFPSSKKFHFQNEAKCETFVVEMSFNYDANKTYFHNKGFALSLVLKVKRFELGNGLFTYSSNSLNKISQDNFSAKNARKRRLKKQRKKVFRLSLI